MSQSTSILVASAPCNVYVSGRSYKVETGDKLTLIESEAQQILNGPYGSRFIHVAYGLKPEKEEPLLADQVVNGQSTVIPLEASVDEQLLNPPLSTENLGDLVPQAPLPTPALVDAKEIEDQASKLMQPITNLLVNPPLKWTSEEAESSQGQLESQLQAQPESVVQSPSEPEEPFETVEVPFDDDAHFTTVKKYLLDKEAAAVPNLRDIALTLKHMFPTYLSVQEEVNRILAQSN